MSVYDLCTAAKQLTQQQFYSSQVRSSPHRRRPPPHSPPRAQITANSILVACELLLCAVSLLLLHRVPSPVDSLSDASWRRKMVAVFMNGIVSSQGAQ